MQKSYVMLDIMKFVMAILVVSIHSGRDYLSAVGQVAVPFFFTVSAMFFFKKYLQRPTLRDRAKCLLQYEARLGVVYVVWIVLYLPFHIKLLTGTIVQNVSQLMKWAIMGNFPFFYTAWYVAALMMGLVIMVATMEAIGYKWMIALGVLAQIIVLSVISYNGLLPQFVFALEPRVINSMLRSMLYIAIGYLLARNEAKLLTFNKPVYVVAGVALGMTLMLSEQVVIGLLGLNMKLTYVAETLFMPIAVLMLIIAGLTLKVTRVSGSWFRQASSFIYFGHLMIIDLLAMWFVQNGLNSYQIFIIVAMLVTVAFLAVAFLKKLRLFKWLTILV